MANYIVDKFLRNGLMSVNHAAQTIDMSFELSERIYLALQSNKMKAEYHISKTGKIVFGKILGRDNNGDFYNEENKNIKDRAEDIKKVICQVLVDEYNTESLAKS